MKFAFAIFRYFPFGGLQRSAMNMALEARERGHQVTFYCGAWDDTYPEGIEVKILNSFTLFNTAGVRSFLKGFEENFCREDYDLLVGFNKMPGLDVYYCGDSCFAQKAWSERTWFYRLTARARMYLANERAVFSCDANTRILDVSSAERQLFARFYGTAPERFFLLPPGLKRAHVLTSSLPDGGESVKREFAIPAGAKVVVCVGSGFKTKGLDRSISAFALMLQRTQMAAFLLVVGHDKSASFKRLAQRLGVADRVFFIGGRADMASVYQAADVLLHPAYREVTGNVLLEAMLASVPVVTTSICGYARYVQLYAMGSVIAEPYAIADITQSLESLLATDRQVWIERSRLFENEADIFSRPQRAVDLLESFVQTPADQEQRQFRTRKKISILRKPLIEPLKDKPLFELMESLPGIPVRSMPGRNTLRFELDAHTYYRKWHADLGWREIIKNLICLRLPILGASNEWYALNRLAALGIRSLTPVAYGKRGLNPARQQSFLVTVELHSKVKLSDFFANASVGFREKRLVIAEVARIARAMHMAGINHRDFYLCHFLLAPETLVHESQNFSGGVTIYLVDLHRAQLRNSVPYRWRVKDIGGLYFSALDLGLTRNDILYFLRNYFAQDLRDLLHQHNVLLRDIERRAIATYKRDFLRAPRLPFSSTNH